MGEVQSNYEDPFQVLCTNETSPSPRVVVSANASDQACWCVQQNGELQKKSVDWQPCDWFVSAAVLR
ncbi:hypothetical protein GCK32_014854 [Trichostrongylus colubriformis]|uniref:Uncharacterized protein n=1 Tax=Trichostrongylus colubriformis TaxID=6319 RepID=A0AAN8ILJ9_TRICO